MTSACCRLRLPSWPCSDARGLPHRSTLSRFLAALDQASVEALRGVFAARMRWLAQDPRRAWVVCGTGEGNDGWSSSLVGTRQAARQRALPQGPDLPPPQRRLQAVCAPGYKGRKRGEVVRTRTTLLQAHTHQWLGTCGHAGNADYRGERLARTGGDCGLSGPAGPAPRSGPYPPRWEVTATEPSSRICWGQGSPG